jgi:hypothetical protein
VFSRHHRHQAQQQNEPHAAFSPEIRVALQSAIPRCSAMSGLAGR